jgi:hypothetical protein
MAFCSVLLDAIDAGMWGIGAAQQPVTESSKESDVGDYFLE